MVSATTIRCRWGGGLQLEIDETCVKHRLCIFCNARLRRPSSRLKRRPESSRRKLSRAFATQCNKRSRGSSRCFRSARNQGQVRRCHGDLHLRNIVLIEDRPVLFDAIEFDEAIATCDVLYDLDFLLMDLWTRELRSHANLLFNRYLWICDDVERQLKGLSLLPLFLSLRAAIRAKVSILQPGSGEDHAKDARRHFEAACSLLAPRRLDLVAVGGL